MIKKVYINLTLISIIMLFTSSSILSNLFISFYIPFSLIFLSIILILWDSVFIKRNLILYFLFILLLFISWMFNEITSPSNLNGIFNLIPTFILLIYLLSEVKIAERHLALASKFILFFSTIVVLLSFLNLLGFYEIHLEESGYGFSWIFNNTNSYGYFILFLIMYVLLLCKNSIVKMSLLILLSFLLVLSVSRGAIISAVIILLGYIIENRRRFLQWEKNYVVIFLVILMLLMNINNININFDYYLETIKQKNEGGLTHRTEIWSYVIREYVFKTPIQFILGNGISFGNLENFGNLSPHNSYLLFIGKYGIISFLIFMVIIFITLKRLFKSWSFFFLFLSLLFLGCFESIVFSGLNGIWVAFLLIFFVYKSKYNNEKNINSYYID